MTLALPLSSGSSTYLVPHWLSAGSPAWSQFSTLAASDRSLGGNLTPDAYLASALTHGCRLAATDRGFPRFPGLDWFDPAVRD